MSLGLVIGKFLPFHRGHALLLHAATKHCDETVAIICDSGWHEIDAALRASWIAESFPGTRTLILDQDVLGIGDDDSEGWARATTDALGRGPDVVFTSEDYGPRYAALMSAEHVTVDRERTTVPVSGRTIRADPLAHLDSLDPQVRAHYLPRVCVLGAESTGKTTLAHEVAAHYGVRPVGEFGRVYTEAMPDPSRYRWRTADFELIAQAQAMLEDDAARWSEPPLICDTNPFVTAVFHEAYLGRPHPLLEMAAQQRRYDLLVLCDVATPFEQDGTGLRQDGARRAWMHARYERYAESQPTPVIRVTGDRRSRCEQAVSAIEQMMLRPA